VTELTVQTATDGTGQRARDRRREKDAERFKTDKSGRMVIDGEDGDGSDGDGGLAAAAGDSTNAYLEAVQGEDGFTLDARGKAKFNKAKGSLGKRGREDDDDGEVVPVGQMADLNVKQGRKQKQKKETVKLGGEFKAKVRMFVASSLVFSYLWRFLSCSALEETSRRMACLPMRIFLSMLSRRRREQALDRMWTSLARRSGGVGHSSVCMGSSTWCIRIDILRLR
jgi:hypothetical protein